MYIIQSNDSESQERTQLFHLKNAAAFLVRLSVFRDLAFGHPALSCGAAARGDDRRLHRGKARARRAHDHRPADHDNETGHNPSRDNDDTTGHDAARDNDGPGNDRLENKNGLRRLRQRQTDRGHNDDEADNHNTVGRRLRHLRLVACRHNRGKNHNGTADDRKADNDETGGHHAPLRSL